MHPMRKQSLTILHYEFKIKHHLIDLKLGLVGMDDAFGEIISETPLYYKLLQDYTSRIN